MDGELAASGVHDSHEVYRRCAGGRQRGSSVSGAELHCGPREATAITEAR